MVRYYVRQAFYESKNFSESMRVSFYLTAITCLPGCRLPRPAKLMNSCRIAGKIELTDRTRN